MRGLVAAIGLLAVSNVPVACAADDFAIAVDVGTAAALALLPADHPIGTNAAVKLVSLKRVANVRDLTISTFIVDYRPGGSAVLHRLPSLGYVLVHVLSGSIRAQAWSAGVGTYHVGETWVEPAFANNITSKNASTTEYARALVILLTSDAEVAGRKRK
jgi:quercetin dioxygenase-like cupin family protein